MDRHSGKPGIGSGVRRLGAVGLFGLDQSRRERWLARLAEWIHIGTLNLDWTFRVDSLSTTMMLVVSGVGTLIHIYAIGYMHDDVRFKNDTGRFARFLYFPEPVHRRDDDFGQRRLVHDALRRLGRRGTCSFLLIGFWYEMDTLGRPSWANSNAAKKHLLSTASVTSVS